MWSLLRTTQCSLHKEVSWRLPPNTIHAASTRRHTHPISWLALRGSLSSSHMNKWECQTGDTGTQVWKTQQAWDTARVGRGCQIPSGRRWGSSAPASEFSHRREDRKLTDLSRLIINRDYGFELEGRALIPTHISTYIHTHTECTCTTTHTTSLLATSSSPATLQEHAEPLPQQEPPHNADAMLQVSLHFWAEPGRRSAPALVPGTLSWTCRLSAAEAWAWS